MGARITQGQLQMQEVSEVVEIPLRGTTRVALVDKKDIDKLAGYTWRLTDHGYAAATVTVYMHHVIAGKPVKGLVVDHRNRNKLDNTCKNLHHCAHRVNSFNRGRKNRTGYVGVYPAHRDSRRRPWRASIQVNRKIVVIGHYATKKLAARAYDDALFKIAGVRVNNPKITQRDLDAEAKIVG